MFKQVNYVIVGDEKIHFGGCEARISNSLRRLDGIYDISVSADEQNVSVSINTDFVSPEQIETCLDQLGYKVVTLS
ncbi:heavy-metal-associated domain-containing protein [Halovibrio sp. HP20-50]|jgi:copper chaperone|uniref:heavy-metal-associated domain-containing protein n=1 Tax=Halovibrio sp. HP20-59 TaxID=3080275 RepID=UPI00294ACF00|nr:heavy-metal-associated domain-containing protein [Halovibrio sp. HP20-59]MEA2118795.1 heavy-metal-associated domain-containing protein [Halovibrio sp. HP20-59]